MRTAQKPDWHYTLSADKRGNVAVMLALISPVLFVLVGGSIDFASIVNQRMRLQAVVDQATLSAARELGLADARRESVAAVVEGMVHNAMASNGDARRSPPKVSTQIQNRPLQVDVVARQSPSLMFGLSSMVFPAFIEVTASARIVGQPNICVLALDPSSAGAISLEKNARVTGNNCAVFSNSTHNNGLSSKNSAVLTASTICTAGGKDGGPANYTPDPVTDCPTFDDPLAGRPEPTIAPCDASMPTKVTADRTLTPGTFCGGLDLSGAVEVMLEPGIYVIKDGGLRVGNGARMVGQGVGFYLTGSGATLLFDRDSTIDLSAPGAGAMAGLLVFEGRTQAIGATHQILSDNARNLLGTIYMSRSRLHVDANNPVADQSAYTAIVARQLTLFGGPHLVLNSNYELTDVPVPEGIRGAAQPISLVR